MPGVSKHLKTSKKRSTSAVAAQNVDRKNEESRSKKKKSNKSGSQTGNNSGEGSSLNVPYGMVRPSLAELERMFEEDSDDGIQVNTSNTVSSNDAHIYLEGQRGLVLPSIAEHEHMFEGGSNVELQVIKPNEDSDDVPGFE